MKIREARKTDISQIAKVIRKSYHTVAKRYGLNTENCPKHPSNCSSAWVEGDLERGVKYYVVESESEIIGCMALEKASEQICYLERLSVIPSKRNNGVGMSLVKEFIKKAHDIGANTIGIGIISKQEDLKKWYQKIGFVQTGHKTFPHLPFDVTFMEYNLENK
jgi:N-acetylglutamate synthase-like GNAT family acetyltransferase